MAKNKVINTVLNLRDNMSGGLVKAAKNTKGISKEMVKATQQVVAFKNKAVDSITSFAKKTATAGVAGVTALTTAFIALDGATEEYRIAMGKLNTAYDAAGLGADNAARAYSSLYGILGDTDTATEASQLLAKIAKNEGDIETWTDIAAGAFGTFGDSLPIEGLIEASNETAKVGQVTGVLADALNWAGIMEDDFNEKLSACRSESERTQLITDTLSKTYDDAASAFYKNNDALVKSREQQVAINNAMATLGETSQRVKSKLLEALGANRDGSFQAGSALDWLNQKALQFSDWISTVDIGSIVQKLEGGLTTAVDKVSGAFQWFVDNKEILIPALAGIGAAFGAIKIAQFASGMLNAMNNTKLFINTVFGVAATNPVILGVVGGIAALVAIGVALYRNWDTVKEKCSELWSAVKERFNGIKDSIVGAFNSAKDAVGSFFSWIGDKLSWLDNKVESIPILGSVYKGGKALVGGAADFIGSLIGGNALGTSYWKGGLTRVNERGGEILNLPSGTQIIPHDVSKRVAGGQTVQVYVTVQGNIIGNRQYADELGETIVQRILRALDNM